MIEVAYTDIHSKTKKLISCLNLLPLYEESTVKLLYITVAEVPASVINIDTRAKGVQIAVHEIKK